MNNSDSIKSRTMFSRYVVLPLIVLLLTACSTNPKYLTEQVKNHELAELSIEQPALLNLNVLASLPSVHSKRVKLAFRSELNKAHSFKPLGTLLREDEKLNAHVRGGTYGYWSSHSIAQGFKSYLQDGNQPENNRYTLLADVKVTSEEENHARSLFSALTIMLVPFNRLHTMTVTATLYDRAKEIKRVSFEEHYRYSYGWFSEKGEGSAHVANSRKLARAVLNEFSPLMEDASSSY